MKVLLINGSPNRTGCTFTALTMVADSLEYEGIETEIFSIGKKPIAGCLNCGGCAQDGYCVLPDDGVNTAIDLAKQADGFIFGSPVYYAAPNGALCTMLDRMFFMNHDIFAFKPGAAVVNCRRGGASAAFDRLNKYFTIAHMPVVSSQYWNSIHGLIPDEVRKDQEGMQTMRLLGQNMAWLLHCIDHAKEAFPHPELEARTATNFIED